MVLSRCLCGVCTACGAFTVPVRRTVLLRCMYGSLRCFTVPLRFFTVLYGALRCLYGALSVCRTVRLTVSVRCWNRMRRTACPPLRHTDTQAHRQASWAIENDPPLYSARAYAPARSSKSHPRQNTLRHSQVLCEPTRVWQRPQPPLRRLQRRSSPRAPRRRSRWRSRQGPRGRWRQAARRS